MSASSSTTSTMGMAPPPRGGTILYSLAIAHPRTCLIFPRTGCNRTSPLVVGVVDLVAGDAVRRARRKAPLRIRLIALAPRRCPPEPGDRAGDTLGGVKLRLPAKGLLGQKARPPPRLDKPGGRCRAEQPRRAMGPSP